MYLNTYIKFKFLVVQLTFLGCSFSLYSQVSGCTDVLATNYNLSATLNDGSCEYASASLNVLETWQLPRVLDETSGLIMWNNKIWTHNDDTDINLYEVDTKDISDFVTQPLESTKNIDWEEISQDEDFVYVGDFGNNANGNRTDLKILKITKSSILNKAPDIDTIAFTYALQNDLSPKGANNTDFDCEAFVVTSNRIYVFTKEWISNKTSIYSLPKNPGSYEAKYLSEYDVEGLITGATYLEDKRLIVLSGYSTELQPFLFLLYDFQNNEFFNGNKRKISLNLPFHQVEGIATENGLDYFVSNERFNFSGITTEAKLHKINLSSFLESYFKTLSSNFPSIENVENVVLYPNPARDILNVELNVSHVKDLHIIIHNSIGQKIETLRISSDSFQIDVSDFNTGIYFYTIFGRENPEALFNGKFLVH